MKALVLAGGEGRRLAPLTGALPKCLVPVQGRPFVEHQIESLKSQGITEFVLCVGMGAEAVQEVMGLGKHLGVSITYSVEMNQLGTAGALKNASQFVNSTFLCVNGDTIAEFSLREMAQAHETNAALATILVREADDATGKGTIVMGTDGRILRFEEKAASREAALVNCGTYLMERELLDSIPSATPLSLERDVFPKLVSATTRVFAFTTGGVFVDIGTPEEYLRIRDKGWDE